MANFDYTPFLGKRVKLTLTYPDDIFPPYDVFGVFVGFVNYADVMSVFLTRMKFCFWKMVTMSLTF